MISKDPIDSYLFERRNHRRFRISELIVLDEDNFAQLLDISMGGLAIAYIQEYPLSIGNSFEFSLSNSEAGIARIKLKCKTVADKEINDGPFNKNAMMRRRSMKFTDVSLWNRYLLKKLIHYYNPDLPDPVSLDNAQKAPTFS